MAATAATAGHIAGLHGYQANGVILSPITQTIINLVKLTMTVNAHIKNAGAVVLYKL